MKKFTAPSGAKEIIITEENSNETITLQDFETGDRNFSLVVRVQGKNSRVEIIGRAESKQKEKKKWNISLFLEGKNQSGILDLKGVCDSGGFLEFDGGGIIAQNSSQGKLKIEEKIVIFSSDSSAKAIPVLRVETDDVLSASHSASISPFNEEIFFYLASRGVNQKEGKNILKEGMLLIPKDNKNI